MDDTLVIRMKCAPVDPNTITKDDELLMQKMQAYIDESYANHAKKLHIVPGIAIAANQLGVPKQIGTALTRPLPVVQDLRWAWTRRATETRTSAGCPFETP